MIPLCSFTFFYTSCFGTAFSFLFLSFLFEHFHFLCPPSLYLKHLVLFSTFFCLLTSLTPYCITQLFSTSNLFSPIVFFFFCSSPLLHFWVRCLNLLQHLHSLSFLPSNSVLNLARTCLLLSMSLMS